MTKRPTRRRLNKTKSRTTSAPGTPRAKTKPAVRRAAAPRKGGTIGKAAAKAKPHLRDAWKTEQKHANDIAKGQHSAMIDQRAHVRAITGQRWASRKPR